jgi:hypothetical protein
MTRHRKVSTVVLAVAAAALAAGCGSSPSHLPAHTANNPGAQAFAYSRCIRSHGVADFPDPKVTTTPGGGSVRIAMAMPSSIGNSPAFKTAEKACQGILPAPGNAHQDSGGPSKSILLAFAQCLRSHGISGFPDPNAQGQLPAQTITAAGVDVHTPKFAAAGTACVGVTHGEITVAEVQALASGRH